MAKKPANSGKQWTQAEINKLRELARGNTPTRVIGIKLERSESAIYNKVAKQNISLNPPNQSPYNRQKK